MDWSEFVHIIEKLNCFKPDQSQLALLIQAAVSVATR